MAVAVHVPRINNNDDVVKLVALNVARGDKVARGALLASVETDKAIVDVEAPSDGFVLDLRAAVDDDVEVGRILLWIGDSVDESVPQVAAEAPAPGGAARAAGAPTAGARLLLKRHGLAADLVPRAGERLTAEDVERFVAGGAVTAQPVRETRPAERVPEIPGKARELRGDERGMIHTVSWSREHAVPGYIEMEYDPAPWDAYARQYTDRHRLMLSPLLSLMAWRLVELAGALPALNATIVGDKRYEYEPVNLGFTIQAGETLYLAVLRDAGALGESGFVNALGDIQRRAASHKLTPDELRGATVSFSSMARWKVSRHIPVLPPRTAMIVAHAMSSAGVPVLGASYDHRVLSGFQVVNTLRRLARPGDAENGKDK
jgi:pyruvate/2-oxoglutarate dehydrogenase complex dihydrolipoamide acyltransferase (E2) component